MIFSTSLQAEIARFYDQTSDLWESVWGEHLHHGYYPSASASAEQGDEGARRRDRAPQGYRQRHQAQIDLIEQLLSFAQVSPEQPPSQILDLGCGIGGSTLYLSEKFAAQATGVSLSPRQVERAQERAAAAGLGDSVGFQVADALALPFADGSFDLVWALESAEHFPNKVQALREAVRVLRPGGRLVLATWCHRPGPPWGAPLDWSEQAHLAAIYGIYYLPFVISLEDYGAIAHGLPLGDIQTADWSAEVAPFWDEVAHSAITPDALAALGRSGPEALRGALGIGLMRAGYQRGLIRYGVLSARRVA